MEGDKTVETTSKVDTWSLGVLAFFLLFDDDMFTDRPTISER